MSLPEVDAPFTLRRVQEMLGLSRTVINGLISQGFVSPVRGKRHELRFTFQDLLLLRTAVGLQQARIAPRKILQALIKLQDSLPAELPLSGLRVTAIGSDVVVHGGEGPRVVDSGQLVLDFEVTLADARGSVAFLPTANEAVIAMSASQAWFERGEAAETTDAAAAESAYRQAIQADDGHAEAIVNLGALLCESGRCEEAVEVMRSAVERGVQDATLFFNLAIALEDVNHLEEAARAYQRVLTLDEDFADAHYNLGRLLERLGDGRGALRHLSAYRRQTRPS